MYAVAFGSLGGTLYVPTALFGSEDSVTEGAAEIWDTSTYYWGEFTTQEPSAGAGVIGSALVGTSIGQTSLGMDTGVSATAQEGPFTRDSSGEWHLSDAQAYSQVERRAQMVAGKIMKDASPSSGTPCFSVRSREAYEALLKLTGADRDAALTDLEALAMALSEHGAQEAKQ